MEKIWDQTLNAPRTAFCRDLEVTVQNLLGLEPLKGDGLEESLHSASTWQDLICFLVIYWSLLPFGPEPFLLRVN